MKKLAGVLIVIGLSGCMVAGPGLGDATRRDLTYEGIEYAVHYTEDRAQIDRLTIGGPALQRRARAAMPRVMEIASGCKVDRDSLAGDSNMSRADLRC